MFDAKTYVKRRADLRAALAARGVTQGLALFLGNKDSPMNYAANCYPFRQDSSFLYFFGAAVPDLAAALDVETGKAVLYGDDISLEDIVWTGALPRIAELAELAGVETAAPRAALAADATKAAVRAAARAGEQAARLLYLPPYRADQRAELAGLLGLPAARVGEGASVPLIASAVELREVKEEAEVAEIERAVAITTEMHKTLIAAARPGMRESHLAALAAEIALREGGGLSFPPIATTRGAILHNHDYSRALEPGGLFLVDAGAETVSGYAGDLSSTFPIDRRFSARQKAVYEIVLAARDAAVSLLEPGRPFVEVHLAAARAIAEGLSGIGLMRGDPEEAVRQGACALFFPHGIGHQMGLDVHDMENYGEKWVGYDGRPRSAQFGLSALRLAKALRPGMVHTIEPGVYFIPELIARWKAEKKFEEFIVYESLGDWLGFGGIRDEGNWLVTPKGSRRLGPEFDKSPAAIEALRRLS